MKVAIYGGMFSPPHIGHLWIAQQLLDLNKFDKVLMMPNYSGLSSKKKDAVGPDARLAMCELAVREFNSQIYVSDYAVFNKLDYTYQLVEELHKDFPKDKFTICIGSDWDIREFKHYERMDGKCDFLKIVRGHNADTLRSFDGVDSRTSIFYPSIGFQLSSTVIRDRWKKGLSIQGLVMPSVRLFIREHKLYENR